MTQSYQLGTITTASAAYLTDQLNSNQESLRTNFSGGSEPTTPAPLTGQFWCDTSAGWLKMRDAAGTGWVKVARLSADHVLQLSSEAWAGALSASKTDYIGCAPRLGTVRRLVLVSDTLTASSSGNEWQVQVKKYPASAPGTPVDLFSATVGTFTALGGVGGGVEFAANAALAFTPDQNASLADLDVLELVVTKVGSATDITNFRAFIEVE
tara:strand:+ start:378 stop:1010 length:633 start_codon:yes stop_codon:yes gene_type:complete